MKSAVIFPPLMTLKKGSFKDFYDQFPHVKEKFEEASDILEIDLAKNFFSDDERIVNIGSIARPSIVTISTALFEMLGTSFATEPDYYLGPSLGQVTAIHCSGALDFKDTINMVAKMCDLEEKEFPDKNYGVYFFYNIDTVLLDECISDLNKQGCYLEPCMYATSNQMIVNGDFPSLEKLNIAVSNLGGLGITIPYGPPGHCSILQNVKEELTKQCLGNLEPKNPLKPLISNVDATEVRTSSNILHELSGQYTKSVQWYNSLQYLKSEDVNKLTVLGPGNFIAKSLNFTDISFEIETLITPKEIEEKLSLALK